MVRLISSLAYFALLGNTINAVSLPESKNDLHILPEYAEDAPRAAEIVSPEHTLERRKGGGGRGGGGSSGGGGGGRSNGGSGGGASTRTSPTSMTGGSTRAGSGPPRNFGRGGYYGGGAAVPYQAGGRTPKGLLAAPLIGGAALLTIMPGLWLYGSVYPYYYNNQYRFYNRSRNATEDNNNNNARSIVIRQSQGANETLPVICLCQEFAVCGCDENDDQAYIDDLIGNGSYAALNKSLVTVSEHKNKKTLVLNGTLPNGTTAPGGVDDAATGLAIRQYAGYWAMGLVVLYGVML